jgi:regulator of protease activity HflC (stomatin/prohibitin superfamily)
MAQDSDFDSVIRRSWKHLVEQVLPAEADARGWPVATSPGFERVLLDHVLEAPWEEMAAGPGPGAVGVFDLVLAIEIGQRVLDGEIDLSALNRQSLARRAARASDLEIATMIAEEDAEHGEIGTAEAERLAAEAGVSAAELVARIRARGMAERAVRRSIAPGHDGE